MSLSSCEKCWENLCECGWEYRNWDKERLIKFRDMIQSVIDGKFKDAK